MRVQNFGAGITFRGLYQDAILMTSSYRQNCLWPALMKNGNYFVNGYLEMVIIILASEIKGAIHVTQASGD